MRVLVLVLCHRMRRGRGRGRRRRAEQCRVWIVDGHALVKQLGVPRGFWGDPLWVMSVVGWDGNGRVLCKFPQRGEREGKGCGQATIKVFALKEEEQGLPEFPMPG